MTVDVKELLDLYGYSASEFSKMTRIEYTRLLKLKNGKIKYSKTDITIPILILKEFKSLKKLIKPKYKKTIR